MERAGVALGDHGTLEGRLNEFELLQGKTGETTVLGVLDGLRVGVAVGGADKTDGLGAVRLDFEMQSSGGFHNGHTILHQLYPVNTYFYNVWLHMKAKKCATLCQ